MVTGEWSAAILARCFFRSASPSSVPSALAALPASSIIDACVPTSTFPPLLALVLVLVLALVLGIALALALGAGLDPESRHPKAPKITTNPHARPNTRPWYSRAR